MDASLEFIGTATPLLRLGPFTILTDPNFLHRGQFAYLGKGLVSRRLTEPSVQPQDLPQVDAIVLSHLHGDHFDRIARRELDRTPAVYTTRQAARRLEKWEFDAKAWRRGSRQSWPPPASGYASPRCRVSTPADRCVACCHQ